MNISAQEHWVLAAARLALEMRVSPITRLVANVSTTNNMIPGLQPVDKTVQGSVEKGRPRTGAE